MRIEDLFIGAWVQPVSRGVSHPVMYVTGLSMDTVYCKVDSGQGDAYEYSLEEIESIPLTPKVWEENEFKNQIFMWVRWMGDCRVVVSRKDDVFGLSVYTSGGSVIVRRVVKRVHECQRVLLELFGEFRFRV